MVDERIKKLSHTLVNYSCGVKKGDKVLIDVSGCPDALTEELIREVYAAGGLPYFDTPHNACLLYTSRCV